MTIVEVKQGQHIGKILECFEENRKTITGFYGIHQLTVSKKDVLFHYNKIIEDFKQ